MKFHLRNTTTIDRRTAGDVIRFVLAQLGPIPEFDVQLRNGRAVAGRAYTHGSSYHDNARAFIVLRVPPQRVARWELITKQPLGNFYPRKLWVYQYAQLKGRRYYVADRVECLVHLAAHEIRHLWQRHYPKAGRYPGGRGVYSEVDTESFAIHCMRLWRNNKSTQAKLA